MCYRKFVVTFVALLLLLWSALSSICYSQEAYQITEAELTQLESNLTELEAVNAQSLTILAQQRSELTALQRSLEKAMSESTALKAELLTLRETSEAQEILLLTANESLTEFAKEEKAKLTNVKRQRALAWTVACCAVFCWAAK